MNSRFYRARDVSFPLSEIDLSAADDKALMAISGEMGLALSLDEMKTARDYFIKRKRNPTDVELQAIGQAWSEHCCYKSSRPILREHLLGIESSRVIVRGDAGVVEFDDEWAYALRIESHNHPSAVEPYGGAATGIGGIVRDVLAMGCQPIALIDPLYFGPLEYPNSKVPAGVKHPKYLFGGIIAGIRDYGNRIGIPTVCGSITFDESYLGNCIVNVGCVGIAKKRKVLKNAVKNVGDVMILAGGRTGRDGIHGVTFASRVLTEKSEDEDRGAVQLGDPITKEPLIHAILEANDAGLLSGLKDLGGGGLSCVIGELALAAGYGARVELDKVPLKEDGLAPWEIWVSESQERMMMSVPPQNVEKVLEIFRMYDVLATPVATVIPEPSVRIYYKGALVFDMELDFLTKGPEYCRPIKPRKPSGSEKAPKAPAGGNWTKALLSILSNPNICCRDWVIRQYDHEVRASTVVKAMQGDIRTPGHSDAVVLKPLEDSYRGLALAVAQNPFVTGIDPYAGGLTIIDEMCRSLAAVGAIPHSMTNCLNFGNPEKPERLWEFREAVRGIGDACRALSIPIPSGNVSFYNESEFGSVLPTATVLGAGIVGDMRRCVTTDFKHGGNSIYLIGETAPEMGGSAYYRIFGGWSSKVPAVRLPALKKAVNAVRDAAQAGLLASCHDISDGGLAVALAESCIGGSIGAQIELAGALVPDAALFSESPTRWIAEVSPGCESGFKKALAGVKSAKIGTVGGRALEIAAAGKNGKTLVSCDVENLDSAWRNTLWKAVG